MFCHLKYLLVLYIFFKHKIILLEELVSFSSAYIGNFLILVLVKFTTLLCKLSNNDRKCHSVEKISG